MRRLRLPRVVIAPAATLVIAGLVLPLASPTGATGLHRRISYTQWSTGNELRSGTGRGVTVDHGALHVSATPYTTRTYYGTMYDVGRWTSPWTASTHGLTELVASWNATTPRHTFIQVEVRGVDTSGRHGSWDTLGRWASGDKTFHRTSLGAQRDDIAKVATDTWEVTHGPIATWQLRVSLMRKTGTARTPVLASVGAMASNLPVVGGVTTSAPGVASGIVLDVPRYSQMTHAGQYPRYGGGGEAWCSPTSTTMVLAYYHALPPPRKYAWVDPSYGDRVVDYSARMTYDYRYDGTGNWPFNTAYGAEQTGHGFVTRLHSLREAERFVKAGIPLIASISFGRGQLVGSPIPASNGHLVVVRGFTRNGDVVVNDPAAPRNRTVRRTYDRGQFEDAWLKRSASSGGSGGIVYVIRDAAHPLPPLTGNTNW